MKTIEERAKEYATKESSISLSEVYNQCLAEIYEKAYITGAKEQKEIDEEVRLKKCDDMTEAEYNRETAFVDWYLKNGKGTPTYSDAIEWARKETIEKACEWLRIALQCGVHPCSGNSFVEDFRKVMEE